MPQRANVSRVCFREEGQFLRPSQAQPVRAARQHAGIEQS